MAGGLSLLHMAVNKSGVQYILQQQKIEGKILLCTADFTLDKFYALPLICFPS